MFCMKRVIETAHNFYSNYSFFLQLKFSFKLTKNYQDHSLNLHDDITIIGVIIYDGIGHGLPSRSRDEGAAVPT